MTLASIKHPRTLSVPHSVSLSVSMCDYYINAPAVCAPQQFGQVSFVKLTYWQIVAASMRRMGEGKSSLYPVSKEIAKLSRMAIKKEEDVHLGD